MRSRLSYCVLVVTVCTLFGLLGSTQVMLVLVAFPLASYLFPVVTPVGAVLEAR
jgi:hypothetical protein